MSQLDQLLTTMAQKGASRAILTADQPSKLTVDGQDTIGKPVSGAKLQSMLAEVLDFDNYQRLFVNGQFEVIHNTAHGQIRLHIWRTQGILGATIEPTSGGPVLQVAPPPPPPSQGMPSPGMPVPGAVPGSYAPASPFQQQRMEANNTSGMGAMATVPQEIRGFSWGGFLANWIWGIGNNVWIGLLCFLPCIGLFMPFVLGFQGNEWAWRNKRYNSIEHFKSVQRTWALVGVALTLVQVGLVGGFFFITALSTVPITMSANYNLNRSKSQTNLKQLSIALLEYANENGGKYPDFTDYEAWKKAVEPHLGDTDQERFISPTTGEPYQFNKRLSGTLTNAVVDPAKFPVMWEEEPDMRNGHNIAFADGHVKWIREEDWQMWRNQADTAQLAVVVN